MKDATKAGVLAVVRRMIARNNENKAIGNLLEQDVGHNSAISAADCLPILPQIEPIDSAAGNTAQQRMGDKIKPKSLVVKGVVTAIKEQAGENQDMYVRIIIATQKNLKTGAQVTGGVDTARLLRPALPGTGNDQVPFAGNTEELCYPVNKDLFRVYYDKVHKLAPCSVSGIETQPGQTYRWSYKFKQLPASLSFDEGNGDWPNNFAPFYCCGFAWADGSSPATTVRIRTQTYSYFEFEDA